jgi:hypothetical protein
MDLNFMKDGGPDQFNSSMEGAQDVEPNFPNNYEL